MTVTAVAGISQADWDRMPWPARERAIARDRLARRAEAEARRQAAWERAQARAAAAAARRARDPISIRKRDGWWAVEWHGQAAYAGTWDCALDFADRLARTTTTRRDMT